MLWASIICLFLFLFHIQQLQILINLLGFNNLLTFQWIYFMLTWALLRSNRFACFFLFHPLKFHLITHLSSFNNLPIKYFQQAFLTGTLNQRETRFYQPAPPTPISTSRYDSVIYALVIWLYLDSYLNNPSYWYWLFLGACSHSSSACAPSLCNCSSQPIIFTPKVLSLLSLYPYISFRSYHLFHQLHSFVLGLSISFFNFQLAELLFFLGI